MGYNPAIPQAPNPILQSQGQILPNYQIIASAFQVNHVGLTSTNDDLYKGMHNVLTMQKQTVDPTTSATQIALYNKLDANNIPELFFMPSSSQTPIQLTYPSLNTTGATQYSFVAGPFVIYGGLITAATIGQLITLTPTTNLIYVGLTTANIRNLSAFANYIAVPTSINSPISTFTIQYQTPNPAGTIIDVYYLAIGQ
jgi:hypothetical protein